MRVLAKHLCAAQEQASRDQHQKRESTGQMVPLNHEVALECDWPGSGRGKARRHGDSRPAAPNVAQVLGVPRQAFHEDSRHVWMAPSLQENSSEVLIT